MPRVGMPRPEKPAGTIRINWLPLNAVPEAAAARVQAEVAVVVVAEVRLQLVPAVALLLAEAAVDVVQVAVAAAAAVVAPRQLRQRRKICSAPSRTS